MMISKENASHYLWGNNCDGWPLVENAELSVKQERMPAGTSEVSHYHRNSRQFFYVLSGKLSMEINGEKHELKQHEGIEVVPGDVHQALNDSDAYVEFLVVSQPSTHGDRIEV